MSNPSYSSKARFSQNTILEMLDEFCSNTDHRFWPDEISLRDETAFARKYLVSSRQLTDLYLLALSTKNKGGLVTLDGEINLAGARKARRKNLCLIR